MLVSCSNYAGLRLVGGASTAARTTAQLPHSLAQSPEVAPAVPGVRAFEVAVHVSIKANRPLPTPTQPALDNQEPNSTPHAANASKHPPYAP